MAYLESDTKILLTLSKITKKLPRIFNYQKSPKNRKILLKVIKITKSGHTGMYCHRSPGMRTVLI